MNEEYSSLNNAALMIFSKYENVNRVSFINAFKTYNGGIFESKYYVPISNYKLITIKNVDDDGFNTSATSYLSQDKADPKYLLNKGDIILTMTGSIGRTGIVDENNCYLNQRVLKLTSHSKLYLYCYLKKYKKDIIQLGKGTAQLNLSLEDLNKLEVHNSLLDIESFKKYDVIFDTILNIKLQIKLLKEIKRKLLIKYF